MTTPLDRAAASDLAEERRLLLERLLAEEGLDDAPAVKAPKPAVVDRAPLTFAQETLWLLDRATPGSSAYNSAVGLRVRGALDRTRLAAAFDALAGRHEALRTAFDGSGERPMQIVLPFASVPLAFTDLADTAPDQRDARALAILRADAETPFDLEAGRCLRVRLVRVATDEHLLLVLTHHIISDAWSYGVLFSELGASYEGRSLPPVARQLAAYAADRRERMPGPVLDERLAYWRKQLADVPALSLPTDRPAPVVPSERGARCERLLSPALHDAMRATARAHGTTVYATLLAAFGAVLRRSGAGDDLVIGSAVASRMEAETANLVGYLSPALPMRLSLRDDLGFGDVLRATGSTVLDALDRQDVPYESVAPAPLFRVVLTMQDVRATELRLGAAIGEPLAIDAARTKFDLTLLATERTDGVHLSLWYRTDLFDATTAERMLGHLETLLAAAVVAPTTRVQALPLLTAAERTELREISASPTLVAAEASIRTAFAATAARVPNATALVGGNRRLSYAELLHAAQTLAATLRALGVRRGDRVGLFFERSLDGIVALLGVLEAGAAYVPAGPEVPPSRLAMQFAEANVAVVVTTAELASGVPAGLTIATLGGRPAMAAPDLATAQTEDRALLAEPSQAEDAAYVLFTSGSTGTPKGVVVTHGNLANYVAAIAAELGLGSHGAPEPLAFATVTALGADLGNTAIFPALCTGGTLHVVPHDVAVDAVRFASLAVAEPIDVLKITPSHLSALLDGGGAVVLPRRTLVLGGEPCTSALIARLRSLAPDLTVLNHYGPTEATVGACVHHLGAADGAAGGDGATASVPIGRPLANVRCYVLDERSDLVPFGVPGELFIGGAGVARGYIGRPDLTAERFLPDPFAGPGARMYRTGDRVRRLANGELVFLGRLDGQVKVRGYRVELAEIEALVAEHAAVAGCVVAIREDVPLAYVVVRPGSVPEALADLRARLAAHLPEYMLPSAIVPLDRLPLGPSGKLDRGALPVHEPHAIAETFVAPHTESEIAIAAMWAEALGRERVGTNDTFLGLGGHSILAIRVLGKISRRFGVRVSLRTLFGGATVADIARSIDAGASR